MVTPTTRCWHFVRALNSRIISLGFLMFTTRMLLHHNCLALERSNDGSAYECISTHPLAVLRVILDDVCLSSLNTKSSCMRIE